MEESRLLVGCEKNTIIFWKKPNPNIEKTNVGKWYFSSLIDMTFPLERRIFRFPFRMFKLNEPNASIVIKRMNIFFTLESKKLMKKKVPKGVFGLLSLQTSMDRSCSSNPIARFIWNTEISVSVAIHCYERLF